MANPENPETKQGYGSKKGQPTDGYSDKPEAPPDECSNGKWPECKDIDPLPQPPDLPDPIECEEKCNCPKRPPSTGTCFDGLISEQTELMNKAAAAKQFKDDLEDLLKKATAGKQAYSREKYDDFTKRWKTQDKEIIALIDKIPCHLDCWECVVQCEICPLLYAIRDMERELEGTGDLITSAFSLRDQRHWHERLKYEKELAFNRIKDVLKAWENPATSIDKNLNDNQALIEKLKNTTLCGDPADAVIQIVLKLIPMHLAIAPRYAKDHADAGKRNKPQSDIPAEYWNICGCDEGDPDACCGPDVGALTVVQRLIGPQAYIVDPNNYFDIICCLATKRYLQAKSRLDEATAKLAVIDDKIKRYETDIAKKKKEIFDDFRANISIPIKCEDYGSKNGKGDSGGGKKPGYGKPDQGPEQYPEDTPEQTAS